MTDAAAKNPAISARRIFLKATEKSGDPAQTAGAEGNDAGDSGCNVFLRRFFPFKTERQKYGMIVLKLCTVIFRPPLRTVRRRIGSLAALEKKRETAGKVTEDLGGVGYRL